MTEATSAKERFVELDLLRFVAAVGVVFYHLTYHSAIGGVTRFGYLGVELFFMISGFVIVWSARDRSPAQFVVSRFARLYPAFWLCLAITMVVLWASAGWLPTASQFLANLTMIAGYLNEPYIDGVYWTLQVELKFYALVFVLLVFRQMRHLERWVYVWLAACVVEAVVGVPALIRFLLVAPHGHLFIAGALFYLIRTSGATRARVAGVLICAALAVPATMEQAPDFLSGETSTVPVAVVFVLFGLMALVAFGRMRVPASSILTGLAALTYPLYLLHNGIGRATVDALGTGAVFALVFAAAYVANAIDRPVSRWVREKLTAAIARPVPAVLLGSTPAPVRTASNDAQP